MFKKTKITKDSIDESFQNPKSMKKQIPYRNKVTLMLLALVLAFITLSVAQAFNKPPIEIQIAVQQQETIKLEAKQIIEIANKAIKELYSGNSDDPIDSEDRWTDDPCMTVPMDYTYGMDNGEWDDLYDMCFNS